MKTIVLSDHTGDMLAQQERERREKYAAEMERYKAAAKSRNRRVEAEFDLLTAGYDRDRKAWENMNILGRFAHGTKKSWGLFLLCIVVIASCAYLPLSGSTHRNVIFAVPVVLAFMVLYFPTRSPKPPSKEKVASSNPKPFRPIEATSSEETRIWKAGSEGERRVAAYLSARLKDDWTLVSGYRGPGGEIDQILVGPNGACALETKFINGKVTVSGDDWTLSKYDNYGNVVERDQPVQDRAGRSPSAQVNGAVQPLESFLSKRNVLHRVGRAVILAHDKSDIHQVRDQTVDEITTLRRLKIEKLFSGSDPIGAEAVASVIQHIQRDHEFHKRRRVSRGNRRRRRSSQ